MTKFNAVKIALQIYLVDRILPFHAIYHQKFMSALVRFLATKPRRVYLFPVVIEYKKKILTKKRAPITLYFLHQWSFYISYHIFWKFSNTKRKEYLRYYYYHFLQGVPFHEKKSFLFLLMRLRIKSMEDLWNFSVNSAYKTDSSSPSVSRLNERGL